MGALFKRDICIGTSRPESPHATENPWKIDAKSTDHSGSSRRSSNASANPPEVMVTKVDKQPKKSTGSEAEGKRTVEEVMNLLPVRIKIPMCVPFSEILKYLMPIGQCALKKQLMIFLHT